MSDSSRVSDSDSADSSSVSSGSGAVLNMTEDKAVLYLMTTLNVF